MKQIDLTAQPFYLDAAGVEWVERTLADLTLEQKIGQIMCVYLLTSDVPTWVSELRARGIEPGGVLMTPRPADRAGDDIRQLQSASAVPVLVAANLESGTASFLAGTEAFASPMQVGATRSVEHARRLAIHCARAANSSGVNWAFAPVVDLAINPRNPIIGTRSFGRDAPLVAELAAAFIAELECAGVPTSPKHFPGDGVDDRDQHLCTTNNDLDEASWWSEYGRVYQAAIAAGARTVMVGHIRQRALSEAALGPLADADVLPASLSPELLQGVLRGSLAFNGLIVTDNSAMAGFTTVMPRAEALPRAISAGNDMILGNVDVVRDFEILVEAVRSGSLSIDRLNDAVRRVLGTKASAGLHRRLDDVIRNAPRPDEESAWRQELARDSITVTKDTVGLLPLAPRPGQRVLVVTVGDEPTFYDPTPSLSARFVAGLRARGALVDVRRVPDADSTVAAAERLHEHYDLCIYYADLRFAGHGNSLRVSWTPPQGPDLPRHVATLPTVLVSIADPYLLQDVPMIKTAINGYTPTTASVDASLAVLFGEIESTGVSPTDPFAGKWDAAL